MKKTLNTPLALAIGASVLASAAVQAESNPFAMDELSSGYMQTAEAQPAQPADGANKMKDGACGEGKCGAAMKKQDTKLPTEGKCAGNKPEAPAAPAGNNTQSK